MSKKILIAYFSATGFTKKVAEELSNFFRADLFEIRPQEPYTRQDLDWQDKKSRSSLESKEDLSRPEIADKITDFESYDMVLLGFPVWWYVAPKIINTFIESYDFEETTVIPFCTSGGSGIQSCEDALRRQYPNITWKKGKRLTGRETITECENWINEEDN